MQERSVEIESPAEQRRRRARLALGLGLLTAAAIALRMALALRPMVIEPDGAFYARLAQDILRGTGERGFHPAWPPFYPALIAALARLLGLLGCTGGLPPDAPVAVERAARLVSALAGGLLVLPVFQLARRTGGARLAWGAALLTLGHPTLIDMSTQVMTESTYTLLFVTTVALLGAAVGQTAKRGAGLAALAGLMAGAALLTRPEAFLLVALGALALAVLRRPAPAALFVAVVLIVGLPHVARVSRAVGHLSLGAKTDYNLAIAYAGHPGVPGLVRSRSTYNNLTGAPPVAGFPEPIPRFDAAALLRLDPLALPKNFLRQLGRSSTGLFSLANFAVAALALLGFWRRRRALQPEERAWIALWAGYVALYACVFVYRRFFTGLLPLLLIESAAGCAPPATFRRSASLLPAALLAGVGVLFAAGQANQAAWAFELRALGEELRARHPVSADEAPVRGVMARRPTVAWYADRPLMALAEGGPAEVARGALERGAGWVVMDERDLGREAPELARLAAAAPDTAARPPDGWIRELARTSGGSTAVLYRVTSAAPPR